MPFKDSAVRKQYMKLYYQTKLKTPTSRDYKNPQPISPTTTEYDEYNDDDTEIQQPKNKIDVDTEYDQFLHNKEYIPYPPHIQPFIKNNLRNIQPTRPMMSHHNQNLPTHFTFV